MQDRVSGSVRPCKNLLAFWKVIYIIFSRGREVLLPLAPRPRNCVPRTLACVCWPTRASLSKVPTILRPISGATIPFKSSQRRGFKPSNFAILLGFLTLKTCWRSAFQNKRIAVWKLAFRTRKVLRTSEKVAPVGCFSKVPRHFGWHNTPCIFKTKASRGTKLCSHFNFYSIYNTWKNQLFRILQMAFRARKVFGNFEKQFRLMLFAETAFPSLFLIAVDRPIRFPCT